MRLFRRTSDSKPSVIRREGVTATAEAVAVPLAAPSSRPSPVAPISVDVLPVHGVPPSLPSYEGLEDSDVFVCSKPTQPTTDDATANATRSAREVTLFVHGWHNVEPGLLSWTFPSLRAALDSVQRMKNAIGWCVVSGTGWADLEAARAGGAVLVEQLS